MACFQRDPAWPARYAKRLTERLETTPVWFNEYVDYLTGRYSPARAVHHLRWVGQAINSSQSTRPGLVASALGRRSNAFDDFVAAAGLGFAHDPEPARADRRRRSRLDAIPSGYAEAALGFCDAMIRRQDRARRLGVRADTNRTIEARLTTIRDFAVFTQARFAHVDRPELITVADVEEFLATCHRQAAATQLAYLRQFFTWCRRHKLVLIDPTATLWRDSKPLFAGPVLSIDDQRRLFGRWTKPTSMMHPYESAVGLLALLHALSRNDISNIRVEDLAPGFMAVARRPEPVPIDPATNGALHRAIRHRDSFDTTNPHLIVNKTNARSIRPVDGGYLTTVMANGPKVTLRALRSTRLSALVGDLDPITVSNALGIDASAAMYYLNSYQAPPDIPFARLATAQRSFREPSA